MSLCKIWLGKMMEDREPMMIKEVEQNVEQLLMNEFNQYIYGEF